MCKLLQISIEVNANSVGKIAEQIGENAINSGWKSYITYARDHRPSKSHVIKIGNNADLYWHGVMTRLFDRHCLHSTAATKKLVQNIEEINPDVIQLHHVHGYFLNMVVLFEYLKIAQKPVVWTFHDCWSFTGHCAYPNLADCNKWMTECNHCPQKKEYPGSLWVDRSRKNWEEKKELFNSVENLTIVPVSDWMKELVERSFLKNNHIQRIYNGIDLNVFALQESKASVCQRYSIPERNKILLGAASTWDARKGLTDFLELSAKLPANISIVLVGLNDEQLKELPENVIGIKRTYNVQEMAELYAAADVFVNPTYADTFPTTNLEALACGTPVVTYKTGGSPEAVDEETGIVVEQGDNVGLEAAILTIIDTWDLVAVAEKCRKRAENLYDKKKNFAEYIRLYETLLGGVILWLACNYIPRGRAAA